MRRIGRLALSALGIALLSAVGLGEARSGCETALLVVDVQNVYVRELDLTAIDGMPLVQKLTQVLASARTAGIPIVYVKHRDPRFPLDSAELLVVEEIAPSQGDPIVWKSHADAFRDTELEAVLTGLGIRRVLISGLATAGCVDATTFRAIRLQYETWVIADAHAGGGTQDTLAYFNALWQDLGATVIQSGAIDFGAIGCAPTGRP